MRSIVLVVLVTALVACGAKQHPDNVPTMSDPAVVKLVRMEGGEEAGYCTAWKLDENRMMTAGHCCDKEEGTSYTSVGHHAIPGQIHEILFDNDKHDVCVMSGRIKGAPIKLAKFDPPMGQRVWTAGYPKTEYLISDGYWSGRTDGEEEEYAKASIAVWPGASGSPVLNADGDAVGVLVAFYAPFSQMALLTPLEWMKEAAKLGVEGK
jgi:Trypsin-like peptidase domain